MWYLVASLLKIKTFPCPCCHGPSISISKSSSDFVRSVHPISQIIKTDLLYLAFIAQDRYNMTTSLIHDGKMPTRNSDKDMLTISQNPTSTSIFTQSGESLLVYRHHPLVLPRTMGTMTSTVSATLSEMTLHHFCWSNAAFTLDSTMRLASTGPVRTLLHSQPNLKIFFSTCRRSVSPSRYIGWNSD